MFMIEFDMRQAAGFDDSPQNAQNAAKDNLEMLNYLTQRNAPSRIRFRRAGSGHKMNREDWVSRMALA